MREGDTNTPISDSHFPKYELEIFGKCIPPLEDFISHSQGGPCCEVEALHCGFKQCHGYLWFLFKAGTIQPCTCRQNE